MNDCEPITCYHSFQLQAAGIILASFGLFAYAAVALMGVI